MIDWKPRELKLPEWWLELWRDRSTGPLSNAYRDSTNQRLEDIERRLTEIERLLKVLSLPDLRKHQ
jgi:hypothetical protein